MRHTIVVFFLTCTQAFGQLAGNFQSLTVEEGLAQNTVWAILQDYRGYLWISTADGINRYDGVKFKHYKFQERDSSSIGGITLFQFHEDADRKLWVAHNKGLDLYNRYHDNFERIYQSPYPCSIVTVDSNSVWLLDGTQQIVSINKHKGNIQKVTQISTNSSSVEALRKSVLFNNQFVIIEKQMLIIIDVITGMVKRKPLPKKLYGALFKINEYECITMTEQGILVYNINTDSVVIRSFENQARKSPTLFFDFAKWNNKLYAASMYGLFEIDPKTFSQLSLTQKFSNDNRNSYFYVQSLYVDKSNNFYIGTNGNGLKIFSPYQNKFQHFTTGNPKTDLTKSICVTPDGKLLVALYGEGLIVFNAENDFRQIRFGKPGEISSVEGVVNYDDDHVIIFSGKYMILYNHKLFKEVFRKEIVDIAIAFPKMVKKPTGGWIYNSNDAIIELDSKLNQQIFIPINANAVISYFFERTPTEIWIGTNQGLVIYNRQTKSLIPTTITSFVKSILRTSKDRYFIATTSGLFEVNEKAAVIAIHQSPTQLPSDFVYGLLEDNFGNIWLSHNKGITQYNPFDSTYTNFSVVDGLQSNEFNTGSYFKDSDGRLYFGGINGVNVIDPANLLINNHAPQISINTINLGDVPLRTDSSYNELHGIELAYNQNTISFDFSALDFSEPGQNKYAYFLQGYDKEWIQSGSLHFARYPNLPPGNYTFKIKASNGDGVWMKQPREFFITIIPPVWQRTWFIVLMSIIGITMLAIVFYLYGKNQKAKLRKELELQQKIELERLRISRDLHDNVGAQLSYLITNMEWLADHPEEFDKEKEKDWLKNLSETGRQAILTLRQTIWAISQQALTVEEFADRFKQYALKMTDFNNRIKVVFEESIESNATLSPSVALNLFRICQEAFNNALKHSQATSITVQFFGNAQTKFQFIITDNGNGFDYSTASSNGHYGLKNMRARAADSDAILDFSTSPGRGTKITLTVSI